MTGTSADDLAASWYARLAGGCADPAQQRAFEQWYDADACHREAWERVERAAQRADEFALTPEARAMVAQALAQPARDAPVAGEHAVASENRFAASDLSERGRSRNLVLASLVGVVLALGAGAYVFNKSPLAADGNAANAVVLASGAADAPRQFTLEDGSQVTLDAASQVRVAAGSGGRTLELLRGQAFFSVAKDRAHPFTVTSNGYRVTALGTRFDVDLRDGGVDVGLVEGSVRVEALQGKRSWLLEPGMLLSIRGNAARIIDGAADDARGWIDGFISFDDAPLGEVVAKLNRHLDHRLVLDPVLESRTFSGVVRTDSDAALIEALKAYGIARVGSKDARQTVLVPY